MAGSCTWWVQRRMMGKCSVYQIQLYQTYKAPHKRNLPQGFLLTLSQNGFTSGNPIHQRGLSSGLTPCTPWQTQHPSKVPPQRSCEFLLRIWPARVWDAAGRATHALKTHVKFLSWNHCHPISAQETTWSSGTWDMSTGSTVCAQISLTFHSWPWGALSSSHGHHQNTLHWNTLVCKTFLLVTTKILLGAGRIPKGLGEWLNSSGPQKMQFPGQQPGMQEGNG